MKHSEKQRRSQASKKSWRSRKRRAVATVEPSAAPSPETKADKIRALIAAGLDNKSIAMRTGYAEPYIRAVRNRSRRNFRDGPEYRWRQRNIEAYRIYHRQWQRDRAAKRKAAAHG